MIRSVVYSSSVGVLFSRNQWDRVLNPSRPNQAQQNKHSLITLNITIIYASRNTKIRIAALRIVKRKTELLFFKQSVRTLKIHYSL